MPAWSWAGLLARRGILSGWEQAGVHDDHLTAGPLAFPEGVLHAVAVPSELGYGHVDQVVDLPEVPVLLVRGEQGLVPGLLEMPTGAVGVFIQFLAGDHVPEDSVHVDGDYVSNGVQGDSTGTRSLAISSAGPTGIAIRDRGGDQGRYWGFAVVRGRPSSSLAGFVSLRTGKSPYILRGLFCGSGGG